ncbi:MAG: alpha/beta hydrolase [Ignavibacteriales bacterium UTCHB2]|jgi:dienelactone hydrolase|nr:MAG: alpha/beta hydrolase [Ignavibacteriales bacterium UTCHB2]HQI40747.1 alpha/beta hydrolase [Ignavibacteriaceae bacterium]
MKPILFLAVALFTSCIINAQDITGQWKGILKIQGMQLRVIFNISKTDSGYISTLDSPDQGAKEIPVTTTIFENSKLKLESKTSRFEFNGELEDTIIVGTFNQGGISIPLSLVKATNVEIENTIPKKPQEPTKPYAYYSEDVTFENNKANVTLAGTLTLPKKEGNFPAVILITGSGPQNRDEEILGHKPFLVISDYLTKNGIAVLRYDDRGVAKSTGDFKTATTFDFASDVEAAISYLKTRNEICVKKLGLIGHSEGGIITPFVAAKSKDVDFIILLAGHGLQGDKLMLLQKEKLERAIQIDEQEISKGQEIFGGAYDIILNSNLTDTDLKSKINSYLKQSFAGGITEEHVNTITNQITTPWMINFLKYNPASTLEEVKCPVLALNGEKDLQVPAQENVSVIKTSLEKGGNKNIMIKVFPNLNHLFQECKTGLPNEYSKIEETFSPEALDLITTWIKKQIE